MKLGPNQTSSRSCSETAGSESFPTRSTSPRRGVLPFENSRTHFRKTKQICLEIIYANWRVRVRRDNVAQLWAGRWQLSGPGPDPASLLCSHHRGTRLGSRLPGGQSIVLNILKHTSNIPRRWRFLIRSLMMTRQSSTGLKQPKIFWSMKKGAFISIHSI